ncbi:hypothetical protein M9H77_25219 [Catharanthus roseus]|uniref:Uncharacterized protein n=1 Tax=Catharanthus roseus TaxID=4058 RepID=A0ACC0A6N1_CATRO|nr:hypothetical protein M9H77_25219 [Catharanthus roseus]
MYLYSITSQHKMTDPNPLLPPSSHAADADTEAEPKVIVLKNKKTSFDDKIEICIGNFGWKQFLQAILVSFAWVFDAQLTFISIFTDANPTWHCNSTAAACKPSAGICNLPRDSWSWDLPAHSSIISEWSLECAGSFITGLPASSFFMGCLLGGLLLAPLADSSLGRKNLLVISCLLMSLSGLLSVFSPNVWIYAALKFLCGFGRGTIGTCALVLSTEIVGKRWRGQVGIIGFFCFTFGFLSLPLMAFLNRGSSWRILYIWTCVPTIIYSLVISFSVHESPRWLYVRGRKQEFVETLKSIANLENRGNLITLSFFGSSIELSDPKASDAETNLFSTMKIFWERAWAFRRLAAVMAIGFGTGMVYYGMPLAVGALAFNLYVSVTLNALTELPASLIVFFLIGKLNRRILILGFALISGICSVLCGIIKDDNEYLKEFQIGLELVSYFSAATAFNALLIYTLELFPTCVRNSALSMVRQAVVFGGVFSPILSAAGRKNGLYSFGVFGVTIATCSMFVGCLPETMGGAFCDTLDEEEEKNERRRGYEVLINHGLENV